MMYVYVTCQATGRHELFGPASPAECLAWLRMKKISPGDFRINERRALEGTVPDHGKAEAILQVMN